MKKILVCDDELFIVKMTGMSLKKAGYEVIEAMDGKDGLDKANVNDLDGAVLDINMPNMTGIELTRELRQIDKYKNIPIVIVTTESSKEMVDQGKEAGTTAWLNKPLDVPSLLKIFSQYLDT